MRIIVLLFIIGVFTANAQFNVTNSGNEGWSDKFFQNGVNGVVNAIAFAPNGDIYIGGDFSTASKVKANDIARWNGSEWTDVGGGVSNRFNSSRILDMMFVGNDLYVVGSFETAGNVTARNIAKWDGTNWSAVGKGTQEEVVTIAAFQNEIYIGGRTYLIAGDSSIKAIAKWNGTSFIKVGSGLGGNFPSVSALEVFNNELYVGGAFSIAGNDSVNNLAKWNGSTWSGVSGGVTGTAYFTYVSRLRTRDGLYVCGRFEKAGGLTANGIAKWDGNAWQVFGNGLGTTQNYAYDIAVVGSDIYVTGNIQYGTTFGHLIKWNGTSWEEVGGGLSRGGNNAEPYGYVLAVNGNDLYIGGNFRQAGNLPIRFFAKWDGTQFSAIHANIGKGLNHEVNAIAVAPNGDVYVGGSFFPKDGINVPNYIAKWNGNTWDSLGSGVNGVVNAITITNNGDVYVGGDFTNAGGTNAKYIAKWNGTMWSSVGGTINSEVEALATDGVNVYAAVGYSVYKWDGTSWSQLGLAFNNKVSAIAVSGNNIYVGGQFTSVGSTAANYLAKWDGNSWSQIGNIPTGTVAIYALALDNSNNLYFGGYFYGLGSQQVYGVAKWNGTTIEPLGSGLVPGVAGQCYALTFDESGNLLVGGNFSVAGDTSIHANSIAKWDGKTWSTLGSGLSGDLGVSMNRGPKVYALAAKGSEVFVGGDFAFAGNKPAYGFSIYNSATVGVAETHPMPLRYQLLQNYPNPFNPSTTIRFTLPTSAFVTLKVYDLLGREITTLANEYRHAGSYEVKFNLEQNISLSSGIYFYKLQVGEFVQTKKMVFTK